ncbi:uncharacterized protein AB675_8497 [Cyphellophora attinorum]|uniref:Uncharacterized protein n=1 Tax=Cyphellophora attinorum TaxID=1664694 RepID=A0A0N0NQW4_9EURO|nr:uncharacterized protein AB675_8497 [Phialophora attinorum]KPI44388.1 hypothetical protein AB675_8497 [Phialophora attinorum]
MTQTMQSQASTATEGFELPRWRGRGKQSNATHNIIRQPSVETQESPIPQFSPAPKSDRTTTMTTGIAPSRTRHAVFFTRSILFSDLTITSTTDPSIRYHASTHEWNFTLPDIILYASTTSSQKATLLAAAHFRFSRHARMGFLASPAASNDMGLSALNGKDAHDGLVSWEECRNVSGFCGYWMYDFTVPCPPTALHPTGRRKLRLSRTRKEVDGVRGWLGWASFRNYRILDRERIEESGAENCESDVGVFLSDDLRSLTKVGELRLYEDLGEEVIRGIVMALAIVLEKATRRARRRGGGGGGDGSG